MDSKNQTQKREIKFRAWDEMNKTMHNDFQFIKSGETGSDWIIFISDKQKLSDKPHPLDSPFFQQQLKVMQFTGLHDRNGKEVYEGDVLMADNYKVEIQYRGGQFVGYNPNYSITETQNRNWLQWEIIGNIYENPELLNQKEG